MNMLNGMKDTLNNEMNLSMTENGALGFKTTGKNLLDLSFSVASLRKASEDEIIQAFTRAYFDDKKIAIKWLFYARDVRGGLGERRLFRIALKEVIVKDINVPIVDLIKLVPEYGRFDDVLCLLDTPFANDVIYIIKEQLGTDISNMQQGNGVSLIAKWLPSVNTSSNASKRQAKYIAKRLGMTDAEYRKTLSSLRGHIDVVERKMSALKFSDINYAAVPSKANLLYKNAFLKRDEARRTEFLESLVKGETKINAGTLYPHEIVQKYSEEYSYDETLEQLWKALPDKVNGAENCLVVSDGSGSMDQPAGDGKTTALCIANALAIYFAERCTGQFKNYFITFSGNPRLVDIGRGENLRDKIKIAKAHNEVANTNIYKVFQLVLQTAISKQMNQSELPANILIISDMEFDEGTTGTQPRLFENIEAEYESHGYKLPRIVFWRVTGRTGTIPMIKNELGVALISGFSVNLADMVMSGELDPYKCLLGILNGERYNPIEELFE